MAKISNTSAYPNITPDGEDYLILTDKENALATKTATLNNIASFFAATSLQSTTVALTTTQLLNLFSSPVTLIAAQGANNYIQVIKATLFMTSGSTVFNFNTGGAEIVMETSTNDAGSWAGTRWNFSTNSASGATIVDSVILNANEALKIKALTQNPTQGNGTAVINLLYRVINQA